jgi:hypothetical protein
MMFWSMLGGLGEHPATRHGKPWATATLRVAIAKDDGPPLWLQVRRFRLCGRAVAEAPEKGNCVSPSGSLQLNRWTSGFGESRGIVAHTVMSAPSARPGGGKKRDRDETPDATLQAASAAHPDLPF